MRSRSFLKLMALGCPLKTIHLQILCTPTGTAHGIYCSRKIHFTAATVRKANQDQKAQKSQRSAGDE